MIPRHAYFTGRPSPGANARGRELGNYVDLGATKALVKKAPAPKKATGCQTAACHERVKARLAAEAAGGGVNPAALTGASSGHGKLLLLLGLGVVAGGGVYMWKKRIGPFKP